ncbi:MAG: metalloprotease TldD [Candidatus Obscuribacterales bacterium]|nr:metalloprotease TldD [Candidatus Obscuribacterales bacterium]
MKLNSNGSATLEKLFGVTVAQLEAVIDLAIAGSPTAYCDIYLQSGSSESLGFDEGILKSTSKSLVKGAGVRVVIGDKVGYSCVDNVNVTNLKKAARVARAIIAYNNGNTTVQADADEKTPHNLYPYQVSPVSVPRADKVAMLRIADEEARKFDPRIKKVSVSLATSDETVIIANSFGDFVVDHRPMVRFNVSCLAEEGNRRESAGAGGGGRHEFSLLQDNGTFLEFTRTAAADAVGLLSAEPAPAGEMTVVLGSGWPGVLIHEAVGHGLEGDFNRKGISAFSGKIGEKVASDLCTVIDDGTMVGRRGSLNVDDEGTPTRRNVLIENGVLKGYMQDRLNATLMGVPLTGNGRRENYRCQPMPRMTNTFLDNGDHDPQEIIASVKRGLYATTFGGGQVDITSGSFTFSATGAFLIEDGKITRQVKGATLIGNGPKALHKVTMVGNDMALDRGVGSCGKSGQNVPAGVGQPTIRIEEVVVGGSK